MTEIADAMDAPVEGEVEAVEGLEVETEVEGEELEAAPGEGTEGEPGELHAVKVDGEEMEVSIDELKRGYSLGKAGQKRLQQAAEMKKEVAEMRAEVEQTRSQMERFFERMKADPRSVLETLLPKLGHDPAMLYEEGLVHRLEEAKLTPEQRKFREEQRRLAREKQEVERWKKERQEQETQQAASAARTQIEGDIKAGLAQAGITGEHALAYIPKVAQAMKTAIRAGYEMSTAEIAELVLEQDRAARSRAYEELPTDPAELVALLGKDRVRALREHDLSQLKNPIQRRATKPVSAKPKRAERQVYRGGDIDSFREMLEGA